MELDGKFATLVIVIVLIVIVAVVIFRWRYPTQEERDAQRAKFVRWTLLISAAAVAVYLLTVYSCDKEKVVAVEGAEYGIREAIRERWDQAKAERDAKAAAKKQGLNPEQVQAAGRKAKQDFREVKIAGQDAALKAKEAVRAKQAARK